MNERPELNKELDAITFRNFYYLKQELIVGYAKYKLATYYASDCSCILAYCYCFNCAQFCKGENNRRSTTTRCVFDFSAPRAGHRTIHRYYFDKHVASPWIGCCFGNT